MESINREQKVKGSKQRFSNSGCTAQKAEQPFKTKIMMIKKMFLIRNSGRTARRRNDRSLRGFTLVELLVVMAMSATMIAVTLVSMGDARSRKAVEGEARKMAATIREMQNYALTGKKFDTTQPTCSVGVYAITAGFAQYETYYRYRNVLGSSCADSVNVPEEQSIQTNSFQNGVTTRSIADGGANVSAFGFSVPRGNLVDEYGNALASRQIQLKKGEAIWSVCIYSGGRVEEVAGSSC